MKKLLLAFLLASVAGAADIPVTDTWDLELTAPQNHDIRIFRGETKNLQPRYLTSGAASDLTTVTAIVLYYKPTALTTATWSYAANGTVVSTTGGTVRVVWTPSLEAAYGQYDYNIKATTASGDSLSAAGKINLLGTALGTSTNAPGQVVLISNPGDVLRLPATGWQPGYVLYSSTGTTNIYWGPIASGVIASNVAYASVATSASNLYYNGVALPGTSYVLRTMFDALSNRVDVLEPYTNRIIALEAATNSETFNIAVFGSNTAIIVSNLLGTVVDGQQITNMIGSVMATGTVFDATQLDGIQRIALTNGFLVQSDLDAATQAIAGASVVGPVANATSATVAGSATNCGTASYRAEMTSGTLDVWKNMGLGAQWWTIFDMANGSMGYPQSAAYYYSLDFKHCRLFDFTDGSTTLDWSNRVLKSTWRADAGFTVGGGNVLTNNYTGATLGNLTVTGGNVLTNSGATIGGQPLTNGANITVSTMTSSWAVAYSDADTNTVMLPLPVAGYVLKSQGAGAAPVWDINTTYATNLPIGTLIATNEASPGQFFQYSEGSYLGVVTGRFASGIGVGDFTSDGSVPMTGTLNHGGYRATNLANGVAAQDAVTISQLNTATSTLVGASVTNGLATVAYVDAATNAVYILSTNAAYVAAKPLTNGLATVAYVDAATNTLRAITNGLDTVAARVAYVDTATNTLRAYVAANFATNAGASGAGYYAMSNGTWTPFTGGSSTDGATVTGIVGNILATGTVYNANRLGGVLASTYLTNNQANVSLSNLTAVGTMTIGGVARTNWYDSSTLSTVTTQRAFGPTANWHDLAMSTNGSWIGAVAYGSNVWTTSDAGTNIFRRSPSGVAAYDRALLSIASSDSGQKVLIYGLSSGTPYTSGDYGATWTARTLGNPNGSACASDSTGTKLQIGTRGSYNYRSINSGTSWTQMDTTARIMFKAASSSNGKYIFYGGGDPLGIAVGWYCYTSSNGGTNLTQRLTTGHWPGMACDASGQFAVASKSNDYVYISSDYGVTWVPRIDVRTWGGTAMAKTGGVCWAVAANDYVYISSDYGTNFSPVTELGVKVWRTIACNENGRKAVIGATGEQLLYVEYNAPLVTGGGVAYADTAGVAALASNADKLGGVAAASFITNYQAGATLSNLIATGTITLGGAATNAWPIPGAVGQITNNQASVNFTGTHTVSNLTASGTINGKAVQENGTNLYAKIVNDDAVIFSGDSTVGNITSSGSDAGKYLKADGTWDTPAGAGDVSKATNQTFTGTNTFTVAPYLLATATESTQAVNKAYVDQATSLVAQASITNGLDTVSARVAAVAASTQTIAGASVSGAVATSAWTTGAQSLTNTAGQTWIDDFQQTIYVNGVGSVLYGSRFLRDASGETTLAWGSRNLYSNWTCQGGFTVLGGGNVVTTNGGSVAYLDLAVPTTSAGAPAANFARMEAMTTNGQVWINMLQSDGSSFRVLRDTIFNGFNYTGSTLTNGSVVSFATGMVSTAHWLQLARADSATTMPAQGIVVGGNITNGGSGNFAYITRSATGYLSSALAALPYGTPLYVSTTEAGGYQSTVPSAGYYRQSVGFVGFNGSLDVRIQQSDLVENTAVNRQWNLWPGSNSTVLAGAKAMRLVSETIPVEAQSYWTNAIPSNSHYTAFCSPAMGITQLKGGVYTLNVNMLITTGGGDALAESLEVYLRATNGVETELTAVAGATPQTITATPLEYVFTVTISTDTVCAVTDSIVVKLKSSGRGGSPLLIIRSGTFTAPIPSGQFPTWSDIAALTATGTFYNASNLGGIAAASYLTNGQTGVTLTGTLNPTNALTVTNTLQLGGIAASGYVTNIAPSISDPWHSVNAITTYANSTVTLSRTHGEYVSVLLTNNAAICIDRSTYPAAGATFVYCAISNGAFSVTFCTNSISTNSATAFFPGSGGISMTNNDWNVVTFHNAPYNTNRAWSARQTQ